MKLLLRRLILLGTPLTLVILLSTHPVFPQQASIFSGILPHVNWWLTLHVLQLPLFGLLALAVYLLTVDVHSVATIISRLALGCFVIFYLPYDSVIGISSGILVLYGARLPVDQRAVLEKVLDSFVQSPVATMIAILGSLGWEVAVLAMIFALARPNKSHLLVVVLAVGCILFGLWSLLSGEITVFWWIGVIALALALGIVMIPRLPVTLFVLAALLFGISHAPPFGPLGLTCFFVAVLQLEFFEEKKPILKQSEVDSSPSLPANANS